MLISSSTSSVGPIPKRHVQRTWYILLSIKYASNHFCVSGDIQSYLEGTFLRPPHWTFWMIIFHVPLYSGYGLSGIPVFIIFGFVFVQLCCVPSTCTFFVLLDGWIIGFSSVLNQMVLSAFKSSFIPDVGLKGIQVISWFVCLFHSKHLCCPRWAEMLAFHLAALWFHTIQFPTTSYFHVQTCVL